MSGERSAQRVDQHRGVVLRAVHHRFALADTIARLRAAPVSTLLVTLTLGVALALPALLWSAVSGLEVLTTGWQTEVRINLFSDAEDAAARTALLESLRGQSEVGSVVWQDAEASLEEFASAMGFDNVRGAALDVLGVAPLPAVAIVTPKPGARAPARVRALAARLGRMRDVIGVQLDLEWVERLAATLAVARRLAVSLAVLLGLGVLLATAGFTRGALEARREEIEVLRLVGATEAYVRRPFLYVGALEGALGGVMAWCLVVALRLALAAPLGSLLMSYQLAEFPVPPLGGLFVWLLLLGAGLGWLGARLALLRTPQPAAV